MTENIKQLQAFLKELRGQREDYLGGGNERIESLYRRSQKGRPPREFKETSFLYIRSYGADTGLRPFSDIVFWNSPDLQLQLISAPETFTTELQAGSTYTIRCRLHNTGDVTVPYPKVQFYLCDPTLGFDTRFATHIGTTQYDGLLLPGMHDFLEFPYDVPPAEAGHKCLFARTYSFSPLDRPVDVYDLNPRIDRHIGQKNLHIVGQGSAYQFNIVHQPNMAERIDFLPMTRQAIAMLQLPTMEAMTIRGQKSKTISATAASSPPKKAVCG